MSRILKLSVVLSLLFVIHVASLESNPKNKKTVTLVQPHAHFALFDGLSCSTCEGVMSVVSKQIPNTGELGTMGKSALKLAIKGACAYYTLGVPPALALCTAMTSKIADFLAEDVLGRTTAIVPKSNCRSIGMCPPCKTGNNKVVMVQKKPVLGLPWDNHNKNQHMQMYSKFQAESAKRLKIHGQQVAKKLSLNPFANVTIMKDVSCYACKSILGMVGHDVTNVRAAGRDMIVSLVKQQCLNYVTGIPFSEKICDTMAQKSVGKLADSIMGSGEIIPGKQCRAIEMCPECPDGVCKDEVEVTKGKQAKDTPIPSVDNDCSEPPVTAGVPCTDNYPAQCKQGNTTCENSVYERMMRMECMFTCVCRWLPKFSDLTAYLPGKK